VRRRDKSLVVIEALIFITQGFPASELSVENERVTKDGIRESLQVCVPLIIL